MLTKQPTPIDHEIKGRYAASTRAVPVVPAMRRSTRLVLVFLGACFAGLIGARIVGHRAAASARVAEVQNSPSPHDSGGHVSVEYRAGQLAMLETRVATLEGNGAQNKSARDVVQTEATSQPGRVHHSAEDRRRRAAADYALFQEHLVAHNMSPRDDQWASGMEVRLASSVAKTPEGAHFSFENADCRTNTCAVNFAWPSGASAEADLRKVLSAFATTGCSREIALSPDIPGDAPIKASALLTCGRPDAQ